MKTQIKVSEINNCARCGKNHKDVLFRKLKRTSIDFQYWASCPVNGEPIMLKIAKV